MSSSMKKSAFHFVFLRSDRSGLKEDDVEDFKHKILCSMDTWSPNYKKKKILNVRICLAHSDQRPQLITVGAALISLILKLHV